DVFSLGVVLYEMVAGEPPFKGKTDSHTRVSIIDHEPLPLVHHVQNVPRQLERIVAKALSKDRLKRYQTITDLKLDLEQLRDEIHTTDSVELVRHSTSVTHADHLSIATNTRPQVETVTDSVKTVSSAPPDTNLLRRRWFQFGAVGL